MQMAMSGSFFLVAAAVNGWMYLILPIMVCTAKDPVSFDVTVKQ